MSSFTSEAIRTLIDYVTVVDEEGDHKIGYKYPFNACEILISENGFIYDRLLDSFRPDDHSMSEDYSGRKESKVSSKYKDDHSDEDSDSSSDKQEGDEEKQETDKEDKEENFQEVNAYQELQEEVKKVTENINKLEINSTIKTVDAVNSNVSAEKVNEISTSNTQPGSEETSQEEAAAHIKNEDIQASASANLTKNEDVHQNENNTTVPVQKKESSENEDKKENPQTGEEIQTPAEASHEQEHQGAVTHHKKVHSTTEDILIKEDNDADFFEMSDDNLKDSSKKDEGQVYLTK